MNNRSTRGSFQILKWEKGFERWMTHFRQASKHERRMGDETEGMGNRTAVWTKANTRTPRARYLTETLLLLRRSGSERVRGKGSDPSITTAMNIRKRPKKRSIQSGPSRSSQNTANKITPLSKASLNLQFTPFLQILTIKPDFAIGSLRRRRRRRPPSVPNSPLAAEKRKQLN